VVTTTPAQRSGTFDIGGDLPVVRLGFGAMRLTGDGIWGEPADPDECIRVLRRATELGVTFLDTADSYGPFVSEQLIRRALHPYPEDVVIATKAGLTRHGPGIWRPLGRPEYLRQQCELSLRNLGVDRIDLYQLHRIDRTVPVEDQIGELVALRDEGKIRHIGLSEVTVDQLDRVSAMTSVATVQNRYNVGDREAEPLVSVCEERGIGFIPWYPMASGDLARPGGPLDSVARAHGATPSQLALAWLLRRSPVMLPIPGTSRVAHLEENVAAAEVDLTDAEMAGLTEAVTPS
jgi:aryl-alcohol dehydrogenase-like predicted oxidoreductase